MCLAVPAKVIRIQGDIADIDIEGAVTRADLSVLPEVKVGDYVLVHAGLAIHKYDEAEALANLELIRELFQNLDAHG